MLSAYPWVAECQSAQKGRRRRSAAIIAAVAAVIVHGGARADNYYLEQPGSADWNSTSDNYYSWLDNNTNDPDIFVPPDGSTAYLLQSGTNGVSNTVVNYNNAYSSGLSELDIESGNQLSQSGGTTSISVTGNTFLGYDQGSAGQYFLSAGTGSFNTLYLGYNGNGTINQTGGTLHATSMALGYLSNGTNPAGVGLYNLSNSASLIVDTNVSVGDSGVGYFNQYGGSFTLGGSGTNGLLVGYHAGSSGSVALSGGSIYAVGSEYFGYGGSGAFNQTGGTNTVGGAFGGSNHDNLYLGYAAGSSGTYILSGGLLSVSNSTYVGYTGTASFIQSGGTHQTFNLYVGFSGAAVGTYSLNNGLLTAANQLILADSAFASGTFMFGSGTVTTTFEAVGYLGRGYLAQNGGVNQTSSLVLGVGLAASGEYDMNAGTLSTSSVSIGNTGTNVDVVNLNGGTFIASAGIFLSPSGVFSQSTNSILSAAVFTQSGGSVSGSLQNQGSFVYNSGIFSGQLLNQGSVTLNADFAAGNGIYNASVTPLTISNRAVTLNGAGLINDGTLNLSSTLSASTEIIGYTNVGSFNQTGGSNTTASLYIAYTNSASGTYSLSAGVLTSNTTVNGGQFTQSGGTASLGTLTGMGTMTLGGAAELTSVTNFQQSNITINSGGYLAVASNTTQYTNTVTSLIITGSGQLDLANHTLVTTTDPGTIRQYLIAGANIVGTNPATWNGTGGISSVNAAASTNHLTALGYSSGTHSALGIALGLASNQTVVKYTIYGDANLDGSVDISDLDIVLSNYASGKPPSWDTGDFTYAGQTDITDLNIVLSNYAKTAPTSVATPSVARSSAKASASTSSGPQTLTGTVSPAVASGAIELDVNTMTGDAVLNPNNAKVVSLQVASSSGNLIPNNWHDLSFYYGTPNWADSSFQTINLAEYDTAYTSRHNSLLLTAPVDYGDIFNTSGPHDLTFEYGIPDADGSDVDTEVGAVVYSSTPEPTTLGLMGLAMAGLMGRRRRCRREQN